MNYLLPIFGAIGLVFRLWVCEVRLKPLLEHRRRHLSRFLACMFFLGMMAEFSYNTFSLIIIVALPTMVASFVFFDVPFYYVIIRDKDEEAHGHRFWLVLERLTLHPPMIIMGIMIYIWGFHDLFYPVLELPMLITGTVLVFVFYFMHDPRWAIKDEPPSGYIILFGAAAETIFFVIFYFVTL
jgi:hypothetical protein